LWIRFTTGALAVLALIPAIAEAQVSPKRWQATVLFTSLRFADLDPSIEQSHLEAGRDFPLATWWEPGVGVRLAFRLTDHLSVEAEATLFTRYADLLREVEVEGRGQVAPGGAKGQLVAGLVLRHTLSGVVVLGRVRPGAVSFTGFPAIFVRSQSGRLIGTVTTPATFPALDVGGGVEKQLSSRILVRFDVGDSIIWYRPTPKELNPSYSRHNLQLTGGVGFCF